MNRLGLQYRHELTGDAKELYDEFAEYTGNHYSGDDVTYMLRDGRMIGPFGAQLHFPEIGYAFLAFAKALRDIRGLDARSREIAIIVTGGCEGAAYELYAHDILGQKQGLSTHEIDQLHKTIMPKTFVDERSKVAFDVAHELTTKAGPLAEEQWSRAVRALGQDGTVALIQTVGFYRYLSTVLRGFDCKVPDTKDRVEVHQDG